MTNAENVLNYKCTVDHWVILWNKQNCCWRGWGWGRADYPCGVVSLSFTHLMVIDNLNRLNGTIFLKQGSHISLSGVQTETKHSQTAWGFWIILWRRHTLIYLTQIPSKSQIYRQGSVYDKDHMSELRIKNRSERDLRSCEVTYLQEVMGSNRVEASDFFLGFICNCLSYFITAKISFPSIQIVLGK